MKILRLVSRSRARSQEKAALAALLAFPLIVMALMVVIAKDRAGS